MTKKVVSLVTKNNKHAEESMEIFLAGLNEEMKKFKCTKCIMLTISDELKDDDDTFTSGYTIVGMHSREAIALLSLTLSKILRSMEV